MPNQDTPYHFRRVADSFARSVGARPIRTGSYVDYTETRIIKDTSGFDAAVVESTSDHVTVTFSREDYMKFLTTRDSLKEQEPQSIAYEEYPTRRIDPFL
jgi:hypothetical protein